MLLQFAPVSPDAFTIIARGKFRRDLQIKEAYFISCLLYTSDAADE